MNVGLWAILLTLTGAVLVALSVVAPILAGTGLIIGAVGLLMAMMTLLFDLGRRRPAAPRPRP